MSEVDKRPGILRLALAGVFATIADYALRAAVRLNGTLTKDELRQALRGDE